MDLLELLTNGFVTLFDGATSGTSTNADQAARKASDLSSQSRSQLQRLAEVVELRFKEVEQENALLSVLVMRLLAQLSQSQPEVAQQLIAEVSAVWRDGDKDTLNASAVLRKLLDLPPQPHTPIATYTRPKIVATRPEGTPPRAPTQTPRSRRR